MIQAILDLFKPKRNDPVVTDNEMSNKVLLTELKEHFKSELEKLSVGERMLYPMSFKVLLHHEDYDYVKESFPFVLPEVVKEFYKVIKAMKKSYPDFTPPAKEWVFQFSPCRVADVDLGDGKSTIVTKGHITTVASIMALDLRQNNQSVSSNTRVSIKIQNSNVMRDMNVNWDAISKIDIITENYFRCKFDMTLNPKSVDVTKGDTTDPTEKSLAILSYMKNGKTITFNMQDSLIDISGPEGAENSRTVFRIEQSSLSTPHLQIKYTPESKRFQVAAYGKARVSGRELEISQPGMAKWYILANNSNMLINDEVSVKFEIK